MRLDLRLMGVLYGILIMGLLTGRELSAHRRLRRRKEQPLGPRQWSRVYCSLIGLTFMVLGFLGLLFGNLIKAAVSRQREFLADASAVQFTRNPEGIAGALKRIGAAMFGSKLAARGRQKRATCTLPKVSPACLRPTRHFAVRIRRIDPQWDGKYPPATSRRCRRRY